MSELDKKSRFLSLVLRHKPEAAGLSLDSGGWVEVPLLLAGLASAGHTMTLSELQTLVERSDKQRFAFSSDGLRIRANQGHSLPVQLDLPAATPPPILYHGTVERSMASISEQGLKPGERQHVHLSADRHTAFKVGSRRGTAIILQIDAKAMHSRGFLFFVSDNGVWLTDAVPPEFLQPLDD